MATDVTIHPVVMLKVGPYEENKSGHRICEMNQDAYIFQRLNLGDIGLSEHLDSGIAMCGDPDDPDLLDPDVRSLWQKMFEDVYPDEFESNPPDIDKWHRRFKVMVGDIASSGNILMPIARHVAGEQGPGISDMQYIEELETPESPMHFDDLFDRAVSNVEVYGHW